jgi:predicted dehydrogenase
MRVVPQPVSVLAAINERKTAILTRSPVPEFPGRDDSRAVTSVKANTGLRGNRRLNWRSLLWNHAMNTTRRDFLAASAGLLSLPAGLYKSALLAGDAPSERIRIGMIGVGNQGGPSNNLKYFQKNVVAVCDVDKKYLNRAVAFQEKGGHAKPQTFEDFRKLLDVKDIDAVVVTVPDQWHAIMTVNACDAGKHVYCEKPLTLTVAEGRYMIAAARKNKKIVQTGSMQRSAREFQVAVDLVRKGAIGRVQTIKVGLPKPNWLRYQKKEGEPNRMPLPDSDPPAELNYDLWLGPAPERPYNAQHVHYLFRFYWDYSGGQQTNFGAHHLDIAQWGLGMDDSGPIEVEGAATYHPQRWYETPDTTEIKYVYPGGITMYCGQSYAGGTEFIGTKGSIHVTRGKLTSKPGDILKDVEWKRPGDPSPNVAHIQNFYDCIKSGKLPICDVAIGHRSATVCHLGNIAIRAGRKLQWNPTTEKFLQDKDADKHLVKEYRHPWVI